MYFYVKNTVLREWEVLKVEQDARSQELKSQVRDEDKAVRRVLQAMRTAYLPKSTTLSKVFFTGATVGPLVDSIHNQCLLRYDILPITIQQSAPLSDAADAAAALTESADPLLCTSWLIPPLLGVAYVVLGGILPRIMQNVVVLPVSTLLGGTTMTQSKSGKTDTIQASAQKLRTKAIVAVVTTALIIKLSELLQTHSLILPGIGTPDSEQSYVIMLLAALVQWLLLDGTPAALLAAAITSIGGPLSELPFVAASAWHYIPSAADYLPLSSLASGGGPLLDGMATFLLGDGYSDLALSSITGPCYFAVTMDSNALGRWFAAQEDIDVDTGSSTKDSNGSTR